MSSKSDILKRIASIRRRGAKFDNDVHETAVLCLEHAREHGDVTLLTKLVAAMPRSGRREALIYWARYFGPVKFNAKQETFRLDQKRVKNGESFDMEGANATPFYDLTKEKRPAQYDLEKAIKGFIRAVKKGREQGNIQAGQTTIEQSVHEALNTALTE